jgi:cation diffusion facilitator CzcD-associated flavoprotein CzcO
LAVGGCLRRRQIPFVLLERHEQVANAWRQHYERLHLHTTKRFSALPYLRFPAQVPRYPSRQQVVDYLDAYTQRFDLQPRCGQNVVSVRRTEEGWEVATEHEQYIADSVVMATGLNETPRLPNWSDQERFRGSILHSSQYHAGGPFRDQRVLVVGFGNSGAEIAMDLYEHGATVGMAVRSPVNVVFQDRFGIPVQLLAILLSPLPPRTLDAIIGPVMRATFGDLSPYGLRHALDGVAMQLRVHAKVPVIDKGTIAMIKQGRIKVFPGIERFTAEGVRFSDGTLGTWDAVVLATGYDVRLVSLLQGCDGVLDTYGVPRKSGNATAIPGLYFCGFRNDIGGLLRQIGREAQQIVQEIARSSSKTLDR